VADQLWLRTHIREEDCKGNKSGHSQKTTPVVWCESQRSILPPSQESMVVVQLFIGSGSILVLLRDQRLRLISF